MSLAAAVTTAIRAETSPGRGRQLVDKTIDALGGEAFLNMRTRTEIGRASSFYRDRLTGFSAARLYTKYLPPAAAKPGEGWLARREGPLTRARFARPPSSH